MQNPRTHFTAIDFLSASRVTAMDADMNMRENGPTFVY
jgi:hypothetical protein